MVNLTTKKTPSFSALVQRFFTEYLREQRALSPCTIAAYRDTFVLFLAFAQKRLKKAPTSFAMTDITSDLILRFLDHLEQERHNSVRSRNARRAALRAFLKFAARNDIESLQVIEQALSIPSKRFENPVLGSLTREEIEKIIGDAGSDWISQRDHLLLGLLYNSGARVSEIIGVRVGDVVLAEAPCVHLRGKGRKQRSIPLRAPIVQEIKAWLRRNPSLSENDALLPNRTGTPMTRSNVTQRLQRAVHAASQQMDSLSKRTISPHTLRHSIAIHLLQSGTAIEVIALYLGHERPTTTHMYTEADLAMKEQALGRLQPSESKIARYRPSDTLLEFLKTL